jgi:hypothetical protein
MCADGIGHCRYPVPGQLRNRPLRLPVLKAGAACPASEGKEFNLSNVSGVAFLSGPEGVLIPQLGDVAHGIVDLAPSDVPGWYGIKTHWLVGPAYTGVVVFRAMSLEGSGPISILSDAEPGALVIGSGVTANGADGWRDQPSGTYVKHAGCYGVQIDGTSFSRQLVFQAVGG